MTNERNDPNNLIQLTGILDRITGHIGCAVIDGQRVVARAAFAPITASVAVESDSSEIAVFAAISALDTDLPVAVYGVDQTNMYAYSGGCVIIPNGAVITTLRIPLVWWDGPLTQAADVLVESMVGTAAWHSIRSHPERLFGGVGVDAGVMQDCPVDGSEGSQALDEAAPNIHRALASVGEASKQRGTAENAEDTAHAAASMMVSAADAVLNEWTASAGADFRNWDSPLGERIGIRAARHPHVGWGVQLLLSIPAPTDVDLSYLAASLGQTDWVAPPGGLAIGAWAGIEDHVEYRTFIPVRLVEAVPPDALTEFCASVIESVVARVVVVERDQQAEDFDSGWESDELPREAAARAAWRIRPITDDGLSEEPGHMVILTEFGGVTVDPYWVLRYAERLTDDDCSSPAAYGYLRWADKEMSLGLAEWGTGTVPHVDTEKPLRSARERARQLLADDEEQSDTQDQ